MPSADSVVVYVDQQTCHSTPGRNAVLQLGKGVLQLEPRAPPAVTDGRSRRAECEEGGCTWIAD